MWKVPCTLVASLELAKAVAFLLSLEGGSSVRDWHLRAEVFSALGPPFLCTVPDLPGARFTQAGRGMILPASGP